MLSDIPGNESNGQVIFSGTKDEGIITIRIE
jgi:hypothetical protein